MYYTKNWLKKSQRGHLCSSSCLHLDAGMFSLTLQVLRYNHREFPYILVCDDRDPHFLTPIDNHASTDLEVTRLSLVYIYVAFFSSIASWGHDSFWTKKRTHRNIAADGQLYVLTREKMTARSAFRQQSLLHRTCSSSVS